MLTTAEVTPKQTVRNVESALIAHLGMRVSHKKISVATTLTIRSVVGGREAANSPEAAGTPSVGGADTIRSPVVSRPSDAATAE